MKFSSEKKYADITTVNKPDGVHGNQSRGDNHDEESCVAQLGLGFSIIGPVLLPPLEGAEL